MTVTGRKLSFGLEVEFWRTRHHLFSSQSSVNFLVNLSADIASSYRSIPTIPGQL